MKRFINFVFALFFFCLAILAFICAKEDATDNGVARGGMYGGGDVITISYGYINA